LIAWGVAVLFVPSVERCIAPLPLKTGVVAVCGQIFVELGGDAVWHPLEEFVGATLSVEIRHLLLPLRKHRDRMRAERWLDPAGD
jgi:hypothetical protein